MIGRMTDSKHILIRLVLLILLTGQLTSCHANSMLFKKLRSIPSLLGKNEINTTKVENNTQTLTNRTLQPTHLLNQRFKRQYFKPSPDGTWFQKIDTSERAINLAKRREASPMDATSGSNKTQRVKNDEKPASSGINSKSEVTVASLSISLINLFDRIKETLCGLINNNCKSLPV